MQEKENEKQTSQKIIVLKTTTDSEEVPTTSPQTPTTVQPTTETSTVTTDSETTSTTQGICL